MHGNAVILKLKRFAVPPLQSVNLVMELCSGGELFEVLMRRKRFPEAEAARVVRSVISVVHAMHTRGMMHRDLKPENVVLANEDSATSVRVVDFGHAIGYRAGEHTSFSLYDFTIIMYDRRVRY